MIIGFDLATKLCGWCAGDGAHTPEAGAFRLHRREVPAELGCEFKTLILTLHRRFPAEAWFVEEPIVNPAHDSRWTLERLMGLWFLLHTLAGSLNIPCTSVDQSTVKAEWSGIQRHPSGWTEKQRRRENKAAMIRMCEKVGIALPPNPHAGQEDAADACGVWKVGLRLSKNPHLQAWDRAIYGHRGALL